MSTSTNKHIQTFSVNIKGLQQYSPDNTRHPQQQQQQQHVMGQSPTQRPHKRGPWSQSEDSYLLYLVSKSQPQNWVRISQEIGSRSAKQCRERYHQNLKPSLNRDTITEDEGRMIEYLVITIGKRWADIARKLNGRSDNQVKNWWNGSMNRRRRAESKRQNGRPSQSPVPFQQQQQHQQLPLPTPTTSQQSLAGPHLPPISCMDQRPPLHERRYQQETQYPARHLELPTINTATPRYMHSAYPLESPLPSPSSGAPSPGTEVLSVPQSPAYTTSSPHVPRDPRSVLLPTPPAHPQHHHHHHHNHHHRVPSLPTRSFREEYGRIILPPIASPMSTAPSSPSSSQGGYVAGQQSPQKDSRLSLRSLIN